MKTYNDKIEHTFEILDGGHVYLQAFRDHDGKIVLKRYPLRADADDLARLGKWATDWRFSKTAKEYRALRFQQPKSAAE